MGIIANVNSEQEVESDKMGLDVGSKLIALDYYPWRSHKSSNKLLFSKESPGEYLTLLKIRLSTLVSLKNKKKNSFTSGWGMATISVRIMLLYGTHTWNSQKINLKTYRGKYIEKIGMAGKTVLYSQLIIVVLELFIAF